MSSPAKAGDPVNTELCDYWMPAFAGMTPEYVATAAEKLTAS
jgi:hypothetical protein